jgi:hypothetical protein
MFWHLREQSSNMSTVASEGSAPFDTAHGETEKSVNCYTNSPTSIRLNSAYWMICSDLHVDYRNTLLFCNVSTAEVLKASKNIKYAYGWT